MMNTGKAKPAWLIIGQGAAGAAAANELRRLDSEAAITVIAGEQAGFYSRIDLPDIISGKRRPEEAVLQSPAQFQAAGIRCLTGVQAVTIRPEDHYVELASGQRLPYDRLLLATGAQPVLPGLPGMTAAGVYTLWTLEQAAAIALAAAGARAAVVIGSGLIGLKTALALRQRGLQVTVIERMNRVLPQQLDETGAALLAAALRNRGIEVLTGVQVAAVATGGGKVAGIQAGSRLVPCELVLCAAGVRADTALARTAGLAIGAGIVVNEFLQTSQADIYAAGDAAEVIAVLAQQRCLSAGWPAAVEQGIIAARNLSGRSTEAYGGYLAKNSVEIAGVPLVSAGNVQGGDGAEVLIRRTGHGYKRLVIKNNRLRGFLLMGDIRQAGVLAGVMARTDAGGYGDAAGAAGSYVDLLAF
ncbi:NAD(P)/FAD-dependent oxidoreductase [Sporomusa termitida]|uniref:Assimilatory nitrate reductase electron transfer subunit n=1 Tax=Sporomusa termitida TaxID=2377 RepID=A0A517DNH2_9FIRM|nr:FAD-dependent oxidoreductase [Sporomusa termitida]QDR78913.1 Assimilatory nitrate reductase electron transfer subunit [Sporomusa termitida]